MTFPQSLRSRITPRLVATVLGTAAISVLSWPLLPVPPSPGLDASFQAGLEMGAAAGMDVGTQIVSTYGPLAFLSFAQPVYGPTSALALLYAAAVVVALVAVLVHRAAAVFPFVAALAVAYVGAQAIKWLGVPEMALALTAIVAILALERAAAGRDIPTWAVVMAGAVVAAFALGKLNTGIAITGVAAVTAAAIGGRQLVVLAGASLAATVVLWFASGQGLSNLIPFVTSSIATIVGYNSAMAVQGDVSLHWLFGAAAIGIAAVAVVALEPVRS